MIKRNKPTVAEDLHPRNNKDDEDDDDDDDDFVPDKADLDDEDIDEVEEEEEEDDEEEAEDGDRKKRGRKDKVGKRKTMKKAKTVEEGMPKAAEETTKKDPNREAHVSDLWAKFKAGVTSPGASSSSPSPSPSPAAAAAAVATATSTTSLSSLSSLASPISAKPKTSYSEYYKAQLSSTKTPSTTYFDKKSSVLPNQTANGDFAKPVLVTETYDFAGETVKITKVVGPDVSSTSSSAAAASTSTSKAKQGLDALLTKKTSISTITKSQLDWNRFVEEENLEDELKQNRKAGYLDKVDFLEKVDQRQFETEKSIRASQRSKSNNNNS